MDTKNIEVRFVPACKENNNIDLMTAEYINYCNTLEAIEPRLKELVPNETTAQSTDRVLADPKTSKYLIYDGFIPVGLIILQFVDETIYSPMDVPFWYIADFCIFPKYRRQGYGRAAFHHFRYTRRGPYCLSVLHKNENAEKFWDTVTQEKTFINDTIIPASRKIMYSDDKLSRYFYFSD